MSKRRDSDCENQQEGELPPKKLKMSFFTPPAKKMMQGERVFKTPMTFSPRMNGDLARPSPSRVELWKQELGLNDTAVEGEESSNSDEEPEVDQNSNRQTVTSVQYHALLQELAERNAQRDDLLFRIKTLTDKNKSYRMRLEKDEASKKQQLKILTHTHQLAMQEKEKLIQSLEEVASEQEDRINSLQAQLRGESAATEKTKPSAVEKLTAHIASLQQEKAELTDKVLRLEHRLQDAHTSSAETTQVSEERVQLLLKEVEDLQTELTTLRATKKGGSSDTQLCQLELDNDRLKRELRGLRLQLDATPVHQDSLSLQDIERENASLRVQITQIEESLANALDEHKRKESALREELKQSREENHTYTVTLQELRAKLTALQARSPDVVTRIQKVEVESEDMKQTCDDLKVQLSALSQQLATEQAQNSRLKEENDAIPELQLQVATKTGELEELQEIYKQKSEQEKLVEELQQKFAQEKLEQEKLILELQNIVKQEKTKQESLMQELQATSNQLKSQQDKVIQDLHEKLSQTEKTMAAENENFQRTVEQLKADHASDLTELEKQKTLEMLQFEEQKTEEMSNLRRWLEEAAAEETQRLKDSEQQAIAKMNRLQETYINVVASFRFVKNEVHRLKDELRRVSEVVHRFPGQVNATCEDTAKQISKAIHSVSEYNKTLVHKYRAEMALRKKYHNELVELRGNIRVFGRLRPSIAEDGNGLSAQLVCRVDSEDDAVLHVLSKGRESTFDLDRVFGPSSSQEDVFADVEALVTSCVDGYNVCIIAYGQTGSGKTYTMEGTAANPGINQRALRKLFREIEQRGTEWDFNISVSVLEIYNENIRDLLNHDSSTKLEVKMSASGMYVPGLTSYKVTGVDDINKIFALGHKNRATASTNMNEHSSRSHALLCVTVSGTSRTTGTRSTGKLNLVDLAGSERVSKSGADGARLKEAQNINKSLSSIGDVIHALRSKQSHVPYRNSKITYLLQDSLGGDSKTLIIVQVSPVEKNVSETLASLNFAQRVRSVELGQATRKIEDDALEENGKPKNGCTPNKVRGTVRK